MADAEAICEAVTRPTMRFVPVKSTDQQAVLMFHRTRALLMRQRTMAVNALRGHLAEFGLVAAQGAKSLAELIESVFEGSGTDDDAVPPLARRALAPLVAQLRQLQAQIKAIEVELLAWHRATDASRRLETIPGVGFITATAIAATVTDPSHFTSGKNAAGAQWVNALLARRPARLVSVALANKTARIIWAVLVRGETYRAPASAAV